MIFLDRADGDRAVAGFSMTQLPSHSRSCGQMRPQISGMVLVAAAELVGLLQPALGGQPQPVGDVVVQRAMDLAERHAALAAAARLDWPPRARRIRGRSRRNRSGARRLPASGAVCCGTLTNFSIRSAINPSKMRPRKPVRNARRRTAKRRFRAALLAYSARASASATLLRALRQLPCRFLGPLSHDREPSGLCRLRGRSALTPFISSGYRSRLPPPGR